jgi:hypothetical protein
MRLTLLRLVAVAGLAVFAASCASRTDDQTIAEYCSDPDRAEYDLCKQHRDVEVVRGRAEEAVGAAARAQATADQAMTRDVSCTTHTVRRSQTGSCNDPGYQLTSCVQTRYTSSAGGLAVLRQINDTECRFNTRVLEMQVRCCHVGPDTQDMVTDNPRRREQPAQPPPVS